MFPLSSLLSLLEAAQVTNEDSNKKTTEFWLTLFSSAYSQSQKIFWPGLNQLMFLKHLKENNYTYSSAPSPHLNVVSDVQATWMTRTVHPNAVSSPHSIEIGERGIGLRIFVTDCSSAWLWVIQALHLRRIIYHDILISVWSTSILWNEVQKLQAPKKLVTHSVLEN